MKVQRSVAIVMAVTGMVLMVPLVAMQFNSEVNWSVSDFVFAGLLLSGTGLAGNCVLRSARSHEERFAGVLALITALFVIWENLAVGIIGSEGHPANLMYFVVLQLCLLGALLVRFEARRMPVVLYSTAVAVGLIPIVAMIGWQMPMTVEMMRSVILSLFISLSFAVSAYFFSRANDRKVEENKAV